MSAAQLPLLLVTNGSETTRPALEYGLWLAQTIRAEVVLLGIVETPEHKPLVERLVDETAAKLDVAHIPYRTLLDAGRGSLVIARHARQGEYLTVFGPLGRPALRRLLQGRSFRRVLERVETPILYVRRARLQLKRLLICLGGLSYAESVEHLGLYLAQAVSARVSLLHVVEPITLDYPTSREIQENWQNILETDTPQGANLRQALERVRRAGLQADFEVRHGNVVHEILEEVRRGDYDLVGMGSAYSTHSLRHLYTPNVTAEVAEALDIPILTVRQGHEIIKKLLTNV